MQEVAETASSTGVPDHAGPRASGSQRLLTVILDTVFFYAFAFLLGVILAILGMSDQIEKVPELLFGLVLYALYYVPQEALFGRTLGKRIMKTRVVRFDGTPPGIGQVFGRTLCRLIPFEFVSFFGTHENGGPLGWHDKIPKTVVISTGMH